MISLLLLPLSVAHAVTVELEPGADVGSLTASMGPGDEFVFHAGTYELPGSLDWTGVGTADEPISIRAAGDGEVVLRLMAGGHVARVRESAFVEVSGLVFEGDAAHLEANNFNGFIVEASSDITVDGVQVRDIGGVGIALSGDNQRITVQDAHVHDTRGDGIVIGCNNASCWTSDSVFSHNLIHNIGTEERRTAFVLRQGGQGNVIADNVIFGATWQGIYLPSTEFGPANTATGNVVWDVVESGIRIDGAAVVQNNIVFRVDGIGLRATSQHGDSLADVVISHNTVVDTTDWGARVDDWAGRTGMVFANNAIANPTGYAFHVDEGELDEGNYVAGNVLSGLVENLDSALGHFSPGSGYADFEDPAGWDFYPSNNSALIGTADPSGEAWVPLTDFSAFDRDGSTPEVGAYEYVGAGNPGWIVQEDFKGPAELPDVSEDVGGGCCGDKGSEAGVLLWPLIGLLVWRRRRSGE